MKITGEFFAGRSKFRRCMAPVFWKCAGFPGHMTILQSFPSKKDAYPMFADKTGDGMSDPEEEFSLCGFNICRDFLRPY